MHTIRHWLTVIDLSGYNDFPDLYRLLEGGEPWASSPALRFVPSPMVTLARSEGTGVPPCEEVSTNEDDIRENPAFGAGEADVEWAGVIPLDVRLSWGAGTVMKPESAGCCCAFLLSFFFFVFSVLPFARGWASKKSAAWGTALKNQISEWNYYGD